MSGKASIHAATPLLAVQAREIRRVRLALPRRERIGLDAGEVELFVTGISRREYSS